MDGESDPNFSKSVTSGGGKMKEELGDSDSSCSSCSSCRGDSNSSGSSGDDDSSSCDDEGCLAFKRRRKVSGDSTSSNSVEDGNVFRILQKMSNDMSKFKMLSPIKEILSVQPGPEPVLTYSSAVFYSPNKRKVEVSPEGRATNMNEIRSICGNATNSPDSGTNSATSIISSNSTNETESKTDKKMINLKRPTSLSRQERQARFSTPPKDTIKKMTSSKVDVTDGKVKIEARLKNKQETGMVSIKMIKSEAQTTCMLKDLPHMGHRLNLNQVDNISSASAQKYGSELSESHATLPGPYDIANRIKERFGIDLNTVLSETRLTATVLSDSIKSPYDWKAVVCGELEDCETQTRGFYLALTDTLTYFLSNSMWTKVEVNLRLPDTSLVFGEMIHEYNIAGEPILTFHIIDAIMVGDTNVAGMHFMLRHEICEKLASPIDVFPASDLVPVKVKPVVRLEHISQIFEHLSLKDLGGRKGLKVCYPVLVNDDTPPNVIRPAGVLLLRVTKDPWTMALSRTAKRKYFFNKLTGCSSFDLFPCAIAEFGLTMESRLLWAWSGPTGLNVMKSLYSAEGNSKSTDDVNADIITEHIETIL